MADIVRQFLLSREAKQLDKTLSFLTPNASVGSPWGFHEGAERGEFLADERNFGFRGYLDMKMSGPITQIGPGTFQRMYYYDRGMFTHGNKVFKKALFREVFLVKDDKVRFVGCAKEYR